MFGEIGLNLGSRKLKLGFLVREEMESDGFMENNRLCVGEKRE